MVFKGLFLVWGWSMSCVSSLALDYPPQAPPPGDGAEIPGAPAFPEPTKTQKARPRLRPSFAKVCTNSSSRVVSLSAKFDRLPILR